MQGIQVQEICTLSRGLEVLTKNRLINLSSHICRDKLITKKYLRKYILNLDFM